MKILGPVAVAVLILCLSTVGACEETDSTIVREVIRYLESIPTCEPTEKAFVTFDFYGHSDSGAVVRIYGWQLYDVFRLIDDQVLQWEGGSFPVAVSLERKDDGYKATGYWEPEDGIYYTQSIEEMFPEEYWGKALGHVPDRLFSEMRDRVTSYYADMLSEDRFAEKPTPTDTTDPHRHDEPIYEYLNLRSIYENLRIEEDPVEVSRRGGGEPVVTSDGRYTAWIGLREYFRLYFEDNQTGKVYEIAYRRDGFSGVTWKGNRTLVFDLRNGGNTFGDGKSHGVHVELDVDREEVIWAVPYGSLGFPRKVNDGE